MRCRRLSKGVWTCWGRRGVTDLHVMLFSIRSRDRGMFTLNAYMPDQGPHQFHVFLYSADLHN